MRSPRRCCRYCRCSYRCCSRSVLVRHTLPYPDGIVIQMASVASFDSFPNFILPPLLGLPLAPTLPPQCTSCKLAQVGDVDLVVRRQHAKNRRTQRRLHWPAGSPSHTKAFALAIFSRLPCLILSVFRCPNAYTAPPGPDLPAGWWLTTQTPRRPRSTTSA